MSQMKGSKCEMLVRTGPETQVCEADPCVCSVLGTPPLSFWMEYPAWGRCDLDPEPEPDSGEVEVSRGWFVADDEPDELDGLLLALADLAGGE